jgi:hypothetical protein
MKIKHTQTKGLRLRLDWLNFELMQTADTIFMYYYKFIKVDYDKIAYKNIISTSVNL